jgi:hypothetical protein
MVIAQQAFNIGVVMDVGGVFSWNIAIMRVNKELRNR